MQHAEPISPELVLVSPELRELAFARSDAFEPVVARADVDRSRPRRIVPTTAALGVVLWEILFAVAVGGSALALLALLLTFAAG